MMKRRSQLVERFRSDARTAPRNEVESKQDISVKETRMDNHLHWSDKLTRLLTERAVWAFEGRTEPEIESVVGGRCQVEHRVPFVGMRPHYQCLRVVRG